MLIRPNGCAVCHVLFIIANKMKNYGSEIVLRKLIMSQIALELPQNLGIDYHASTEELYYYMRKKDMETHTELMSTTKSIIDKTKIEDNLGAIPRHSTILAKFISKQHITLRYRSAKYFTALALFDPHTCYQMAKAHEAPL